MTQKPKAPFGLSSAEWENLRAGMLYIGSIVLTVALTFIVIATITNVFGFTPSTPTTPDTPAESTEVLEVTAESTESVP